MDDAVHNQSDAPVWEPTVARGHAVRQPHMLIAVADAAGRVALARAVHLLHGGRSRSPAFVLHPAGGRAGAACAVRPCAHGQHHHAACGGQASAGPDALYACCAAAHEPITVPGVTARQATGPSGYGKPESGVWGNGLLKGMRLRRQGCGAAWLTPPPAPAAAPHHENSPASPAFPAIPGLLHPCVHPVLLPWRALSLPPGWNQDD